MTLSSSMKGAVAEHIAAACLVQNGYEVWTPMDPGSRADILAFKDGQTYRCQVKTASFVKDKKARMGRRLYFNVQRTDRSSTKKVPYTPSEIDVFIGVHPDTNRVWWVPHAGFKGGVTVDNREPLPWVH